MAGTILVGYATRYGSTREVAEAVAADLRERGETVEVRPLGEVYALDGYGPVVLGAPMYMGRLHGDMLEFLTWHRESLQEHPVAVFALGPLTDEPGEVEGCHAQLEKELAKHAWLHPVSVELFGGKYDPGRLTFAHRLVAMLPGTPLHNRPASDARDWDAARAWATDLAERLQPASVR